MKKKPLFKINPGSIVKGTGDGHLVCTTTPEHPYSVKMKDHKKGYVYLARVLLENHLGKILPEDTEVHHKDSDPSNNSISNLVMTTHGEHAKHHGEKRKFWKKSPRNKPGRKRAQKIATNYLSSL